MAFDEAVARREGWKPVDVHGRPLPEGWPDPIGDAAYIGPAGEFVALAEPHSEADPNCLLVQFLIASGSLFGRGPHWMAGAARHYTNEFAVIVGATSEGRKGSGLAPVFDPLRVVDPGWYPDRVQSGLSTGEGLIHAVRDATTKRTTKDGRRVEEIDDPGVEDKRLLAVEGEFGSALRRQRQEANTMSQILRLAWDGARLGTLTRRSPLRATDPHVSAIGHITRAELDDLLQRADALSGYANRFLWCMSRRSKLLPDGGEWWRVDQAPLVQRLNHAVGLARPCSLMQRDGQANAVWHKLYHELEERPRFGLWGGATSRAVAHIMRLALIYALLDAADAIRVEHLQAALAVWHYCDDSARFLFGASTGNPHADKINEALLHEHPEPLSRTDITTGVFSKNKSQREIDAAFSLLETHGLAARVEEATRGSAGRPAELWLAIPTKYERNEQTPKPRSHGMYERNEQTPPPHLRGYETNEENEKAPTRAVE
jgi:hypothetical protein